MTETPYRNPAAPAALTRCLLCGDHVDPASSHCVRCHADAPEAGLRGAELSVGCPRCARTLVPLGFDGGALLRCELCAGAFVTAFDWGALIDLATHGIPSVLGQLVPPPPGLGPSSGDLMKLVSCPVCAREMDRFRFAALTNHVVDACSKHGLWFDGGELVGAVQYVKAREARGGEPTAEEAEELRAWELRKLQWEKDEQDYVVEQEARARTDRFQNGGRRGDFPAAVLWAFINNAGS
jgi:Zn-finger nucleic acid-binding protein